MAEKTSKSPSPVAHPSPPSVSLPAPTQSLPLIIGSAQSTHVASPPLSPIFPLRLPTPPMPLREPSYSPNPAAVSPRTKKRKSVHLTEMAPRPRASRERSPKPSSTWQTRPKSSIQHPSPRRRPVTGESSRMRDQHISKKRKDSLNGSGQRSHTYRPTLRDRESESETDPYTTTLRRRSRSPLKERKKTRPSERYHQAAETSMHNKYPASASALRPTVGKSRRRDQDVELLALAKPRRKHVAEKEAITVSSAP